MKTIIVVLLLIGGLLLSSCATIFTGTTEKVLIESNPSASYIIRSVSGMKVAEGKTPDTVTLKRSDEYSVEISLNGYKTTTVQISQDFNRISVLNIFNVLFWAIDYATAAMFRLNPASIDVSLEVAVIKSNMGSLALVKLIDGNKILATNSVELIPTAH